MANSAHSVMHDEKLGSLSRAQIMKLKSEVKKKEDCLGERKCGFFALGIVLALETSKLKDMVLRRLSVVGRGGEEAGLIQDFVLGIAAMEGGKCADLLSWYCKGADHWIMGMAAHKAEKEVDFNNESNGRWFIKMKGIRNGGVNAPEEDKGLSEDQMDFSTEGDTEDGSASSDDDGGQ
eukprot:TRINITY_DN2977_c0_g2_i1.p1 TRINITY_DN2977_c0_g2~~TRINITY_DN2977_c0_g2_i1.p1  ORF type:complete len:178 (+),score=36.11 TRINITY_DN2977_c0_g2_i1:361-894(+)